MPLVAAFLPYGREVDPAKASYYSNMTGFWHGDVQPHNLTSLNVTEQSSPWRHLSEQFMIPTNLSTVPELLGPWNWTRTNKVTLNVADKLVPLGQGGNETKDIAIIHVSLCSSVLSRLRRDVRAGEGGTIGPKEFRRSQARL